MWKAGASDINRRSHEPLHCLLLMPPQKDGPPPNNPPPCVSDRMTSLARPPASSEQISRTVSLQATME